MKNMKIMADELQMVAISGVVWQLIPKLLSAQYQDYNLHNRLT